MNVKCFHATHLRMASGESLDPWAPLSGIFRGNVWPGVWVGREITFEDDDGIAYKVDSREPAGRSEVPCLVCAPGGLEIVFAVQGSRTARLWRMEQKDRWRLIASEAEAGNLIRREVKRLRRMVGRAASTKAVSGYFAIDYSLQAISRIRPGLEWKPNRRHWYAPGIVLRHPIQGEQE